MRVQIQLPSAIWDRVCALARQEHRPPRQQIERWVCLAVGEGEDPVAQRSEDHRCPQERERIETLRSGEEQASATP